MPRPSARHPSRLIAGVSAVLVCGLAGCGGTPHATSGTQAARPGPTTLATPATGAARAATTTRPAPATTLAPATTVPAGLPGPVPIAPLVAPSLPGEGVWRPAGDAVGATHAIFVTELRPGPGTYPAALAWMDTRLARLALYAGIGQPYGVWPLQAAVAASVQPHLIAAFNAGFKIYDYRTGWFDQGRLAMPLVTGMASLVIYTDGTATVGQWGRDVTLTPNVMAVRQNLRLLIDKGAINAAAGGPSPWGAVLGGGTYTWRSGVGVTASGALVYAGGPRLSPYGLATLLHAAGTVRAMELDINPEWVSYVAYHHQSGPSGTSIVGTDLLPGMYFSPAHFLGSSSRDFFALFAR